MACRGQQAKIPVFHETENPARLSDWNILLPEQHQLRLAKNTVPYDLATPLFSDYALKLRTISLPEGEVAKYRENEVFDFPVGTIITKTFYYPTEAHNGTLRQGATQPIIDGAMDISEIRLIETRILVRRHEGWVALPYVWNEDQTDAVLKRTGTIKPLTLIRYDGRQEQFSYVVPNTNQCAGCHATDNTTRAIHPIGPKARHLNKISSFMPDTNQLLYWQKIGFLETGFDMASVPRNAVWTDGEGDITPRARAYLDANCSHCHSATGPADTSGLTYEPHVPLGPKFGLCKTPIAAGGGSGGRPYDLVPGDPAKSITVYRLKSKDPGAMMPELGRSLVHEEGVALIETWIKQMEGACR